MFPMERSRIYKILSEIFTHPNIKPTTNLCGITVKESSSHTSDIDFWCDENALIGYLRIVNPPENCVDGEYCLIYHSSMSDEDANIGIGPTGATRVYGDEIQKSFIYRTLCTNKNKFGEYAKELTCAEQKFVFDKVVCVDLFKKNMAKIPESGRPMTTKEYLYSHICEQLTPWQQGVFHEIYSAIYCTLAESKYVGSAFELDRNFMELVATDKDGEGFHVYFRLDNINPDLPKFDITFFDKDNVYIRMQENEWTEPCALIKRGDNIKIYRATIKYMKDSYKVIVSHVVSKIVLLEGLS